MTIRIKTADPNITVILPESVTVGGPGTTPTLQIKNSTGSLVPIKELFTKIDSVTQGSGSPQTIKIWPFPPTIDPTQPGTNGGGDGGEGPCGACTVGNEVWYPQLYNSSNEQYRWNCGVWNNTGKIDLQFPTLQPPVSENEYYKVYNLASGYNILPPPPGYILVDYTTYTIPDWIFVYCKRFTTNLTNYYYLNPPSVKFYKFNLYDNFGNPISPPSNDCVGPCQNPCFSTPCGESGEGGTGICPSNPCTGSGDIVPISGFVNNTDSLFNSTCTSTSGGCINYCYSNPEINGFYHCRNVQTILPSVNYNLGTGESLFDDFSCNLPKFAVSDSSENYWQQYQNTEAVGPIKFSDIGLMNESDCQLGLGGSAWHMRVFLPFYVSLPDSLLGKYVKFKSEASYPPISAFFRDYPTNPNDIQKTLRQAYEIIDKRIFAAGFVFERFNFAIYWGAIGFPKEQVHTHVLVMEINSPSDDSCDVCISDGLNIRYFAFYPITTSDKLFVNYFSDYMKRSIVLDDGTLCGLHNLKLLTDKNSEEDCTSCGSCDFFQHIGYFYKDSFPEGNTSQLSKFNGSLTEPQKKQLTLKRFIDTYSNPNKITITQDTDCDCTQGIAALTGGSGMEITGDPDGIGNSFILSIDPDIIDNLETSVAVVESIIDTVSDASEGADGGTW